MCRMPDISLQPVGEPCNLVIHAVACIRVELAFAPARQIKQKDAIASRQKRQQRQPVFLAGSKAVNEHDAFAVELAAFEPNYAMTINERMVPGQAAHGAMQPVQ